MRFAVTSFAVQLLVRLALIAQYPDNFSMDGYQRWAGREHLLVQDWLPATQAGVWAIAALGGGILAMRIGMALVGALAMTAGGWVARSLGGTAAGWLFIPMGLFGPFLTWTVVPYQEGTFLLGLFGALALALEGRARTWAPDHRGWIAADLLAGIIPLVRYEGWPITVLYMVWRRDLRALRASWGMVIWLAIKGLGIEGHAPSPINYADWEGLSTRFEPHVLRKTLSKFWRHLFDTQGWLVAIAGVGGAIHLLFRRRIGSVLLVLVLATQLVALTGWMVGLETATYRMQATPGILLGLFAAASGGLLWSARGRFTRGALVAIAAAAGLAFVPQGFDNARRSTRSVKWEVKLVEKMSTCDDCRFVLKPRKGIGTRNRHDGCEIVQGLSEWLHGEDFWCRRWGAVPDSFDVTHRVRWKKGGYRVEKP